MILKIKYKEKYNYKLKINIIFYLVFLYPFFVEAYPDLIRHGYMNCNICHASHAGGDLTNPYGKSVNAKLLTSQNNWFNENLNSESEVEEQELPWIQTGANFRILQSFLDNSMTSKARFMIMQMEADTILRYKNNFDFYFSLGRQEPNQPDALIKDFIYIPQSWVRWNETFKFDSENSLLFQVKWGKFLPTYGIRFQEHNFLVRKDLGFLPGNEKINLEFLIQYLAHEFVFTEIQSTTQYTKDIAEHGQSLRYAYSFVDSNLKVGVNIYKTKENSVNPTAEVSKSFAGFFILKGSEEKNYLLMEADQKTNSDHTIGYLETLKFGHEITSGFQWFLVQEYENLQVQRSDPHIESFGLGVHYFPSAFLNIETLFKKEKNSGVSNEYQNVLWIVGHLFF
jgi:hypothetical protein